MTRRCLCLLALAGALAVPALAQVPGPKPADTPQLGTISILFPFDAFVFVDGKLVHGPDDRPLITPCSIENFPLGMHEIAVAKKGFKDARKKAIFADRENIRLQQAPGESELLAGKVEKIQFPPPGAAAAPTPPPAALTPTPAAAAPGATPAPAEATPAPASAAAAPPPGKGPLAATKAPLPDGLVSLTWDFSTQAQAADFKPMTARTQVSWQAGKLTLKTANNQPGLAAIALRVPVQVRSLQIKGQLASGDHVIWFANASPPEANSDWSWRPDSGAVGIWRADGAVLVVDKQPAEPAGDPLDKPGAFAFEVSFDGPPGAAQRIAWKLNGKPVHEGATITPKSAGDKLFGLGTWGSELVIEQVKLIVAQGEF